MKKFILLFLFAPILFSQTADLKIKDWKNYTSYNKINVLSSSNTFIWAGTDGGAFSYNHSTKEIFKLTNVEGLSNLEITAILLDDKGRVWFGGANGLLDIYNTETGEWIHNRDIFLAQIGQNKSINCLIQKGDSIYILTDFGISIFDTRINEYQDTYIKLGEFPAFSKVTNMAIQDNKIFALTPAGIAIADQHNPNLILPTQWTTFTIAEHFQGNPLIDIIYFNNIFFVLSEKALYKFENNHFVKTSDIYYLPKKMVTDGNSLYIITNNKLFKLNSNLNLEETQLVSPLESTVAVFNNNTLYIGGNQGFYVLNNETFDKIDLNCPYSNLFFDVLISSTEELWAVSVGFDDRSGFGFYRYSNGEWKNYNRTSYPILATNSYCCIAEGPDGTIYAGSWGRGVAKIETDDKITILNETNSKLIGISTPPDGQPHYIPVAAIVKDKDGTMWFTNHRAMNNAALVSMDKNNLWKNYINGVSISSVYFRQMVIDEYSSKWIISDVDPTRNGLFFYNEKYTLTNTVNGWGLVTNNDLALGVSTDPQVLCMAQDKNNELWIGTRDGIAVINVVSNPLSRITRPCFTTRCNISGQSINSIKVDALNNKWLGTASTGIWVLSPDGSSVITQLNTENSPLLSNNIKCITFNPKDGTVYVGTEKGLSTFKTFLVEPLPEYTETLKIYPSPYKPELGNLYIDGLIESSNIKIMSPHGKLIKEFQSPGGRIAYWDGRDHNNQFVASGVYFVVAYSNDGSKTSIGKVAVIRTGK